MTEFLRNIMNFLRYLGLIVADKGHYGNKKLLLARDYIKLKIIACLPLFIKKEITTISLLGYRVHIFDFDTSVSIIESIFIENEYGFVTKLKSPTIVDLGSNIGLSILYFKIRYTHSKILAFEADPRTYNKLLDNLSTNKIKNVNCHNSAVTDKEGKINFFVDLNGPGSPLMSIERNRLPKDKINVNSTKLSNYIKKSIDLVKMDIEGSEFKVIHELSRKNKLSLIKILIIEYHHHIDKNKDNLSDFLKLLEKNRFGYQIHASQKPPFHSQSFEDIQIFAYNKSYFHPKN